MTTQSISLKYRIKLVIAFSLFFTLGYGFTNRFQIFEPRFLSYTFLDEISGFRPWTVFIYMSDYFLIFLPVLLVHHLQVLKKIAAAFYLNFAIHYPLFFFFPTTIERPTVTQEGILGAAFQFLRFVDEPFNCFPSQHVSLCFVVAFGFWHTRRKLSIAFIIWSILISISTLTTKQHYFWDVLGGLAVFGICYFFVYRKSVKPDVQLVSPSK